MCGVCVRSQMRLSPAIHHTLLTDSVSDSMMIGVFIFSYFVCRCLCVQMLACDVVGLVTCECAT